MDYSVWKTGNGRIIPLSDMSGAHLANTIRAIESGRLFGLIPLGDNGENGLSMGLRPVAQGWIDAMNEELDRRGKSPEECETTKVGLIDWLVNRVAERYGDLLESDAPYYDEFMRVLREAGIEQPCIDVTPDNKVTFLHWMKGGTPMKEEK